MNLPGKKIGCAGILVSDTFCGPMDQLPSEGQLLAVNSMPTKAGGCAANVAIDLSKQGFNVEVAGCLGNDPAARVVSASLEASQVNCARIVYTNHYPTSQTVILLVKGQDRRYIHSFGANAAFKVSDLSREWISGLSVFYLGGLFLMPAFDPEEFRELLQFCRRQGVITVVDVVIPQNARLPGNLQPLLQEIDYFLPNEDEALRLTGKDDPWQMLAQLLDWGVGMVLLTQGKKGVIAGQAGQWWQSGIFHMDMLDPSGSGDAFTAGIITGVLEGFDIPRMLRFASALGASAVRALGTTDGVFNRQEAEQFILTHPLDILQGRL